MSSIIPYSFSAACHMQKRDVRAWQGGRALGVKNYASPKRRLSKGAFSQFVLDSCRCEFESPRISAGYPEDDVGDSPGASACPACLCGLRCVVCVVARQYPNRLVLGTPIERGRDEHPRRKSIFSPRPSPGRHQVGTNCGRKHGLSLSRRQY